VVTAVRGIVKSTGSRLKVCSTGAFAATAVADCPELLRVALLPLLRLIQQLTAEIRLYDRIVTQQAKVAYPETAAIVTIPGVGPLTALTFVLLLNNDKRRFSRSRELGCYFGLCPKQRDSGQHVSQLGITKAGDTLMRKLAVQCAHFMLGRFGNDSALRRWSLSLALRGGKNVVAVARKLVILMCEAIQSHPMGIEEVVMDKGYHRGAVLLDLAEREIRSYSMSQSPEHSLDLPLAPSSILIGSVFVRLPESLVYFPLRLAACGSVGGRA
jgi:hypothetical protein